MEQHRRRILFDTNVWANIAENNQVERVRGAAREHGVHVIACPAVVYEILRSTDPILRKRDLLAVTQRAWIRPMSEIYQQAEQLRQQIERRHPEWLEPNPDLRQWHHLYWDWKGDHKPSRGLAGGFWWRARHRPQFQTQILEIAESGRMDEARESYKAARPASGDNPFEQTVLADSVTRFEIPTPGWKGDTFASWRMEGLAQWWHGLFNEPERPVHREWLGPFLDLDKLRMDRAGWVRLWVYELEASDVPLEWLSWAFMIVSSKRRFTSGTPGDCQIGLYLADCEEFATCDKAFSAIVRKVAAEAPCPLAEPVLLPDDHTCAEALVEMFSR